MKFNIENSLNKGKTKETVLKSENSTEQNKENNLYSFLNEIEYLLDQDDNIDFCYSFDEDLKQEANKLIDFKNPVFFNQTLTVLKKIEIFYENLLYTESHSGKIDQTKLDKYEIMKFFYENLDKAQDENSNALLSLYFKGIKEKKYINYSGFYQVTLGIRKIVAPGRFAQIPSSPNSKLPFKITNIDAKEEILNLDKEQQHIYEEKKLLEDLYKEKFNYDLAFRSNAESVLFFLKNNFKLDDVKEEIDILNKIVKLEKKDNQIFKKELDKLEESSLKEFFVNNSKNKEELALFLMDVWTNEHLSLELEKEMGIKINNFSIPEQVYIIDYLKSAKNKDLPKIKKFYNLYKENGLRTFLSIEHGGKEMGDKILILGEKLPEDSAKVLFKTYSDMIEATDEVETLIKENLGDKMSSDIVESTRESLLKDGKNLLEKYADKLNKCEGLECEKISEDLKEKLSLAKKSVFAFSYVCKILVERGEFSFEDFKKAKLVYDRSPLLEKISLSIINMHEINTEQYPDKLKELWRGTLKSGLEKENPKQLVVYVDYEDEVVSAMRVIEREDGSYYGASFNVNPTVQGSKVGSELLKKVLEDLAKNKPFVADCYSKNPMLNTYLNKFGFKITKEIENYEGTGELVYEITLNR